MTFYVKETGEMREVRYMNKNGYDCADEVAQIESDDVVWSGELYAYIAPLEAVEFWEEYFEVATANDREFARLYNKYPSDEVDEIYFDEISCDFPDPDDVKCALAATREILEKRYNLETACFIHKYFSPYNQSDFKYYEEALYQQNTGAFFLAGEGSAMSCYAQTKEDGSIGWGEGIIPLTEEEAKSWVYEYSDMETYFKLFGTMEPPIDEDYDE